MTLPLNTLLMRQVAIACLLIVNFLFLTKYLNRITGFSWLIASVITVFYWLLLLNKFRFHLSSVTFKKLSLGFIALFVLGAILIFKNVEVETLNVDRWSVIAAFWEAVFNGNYPYFAESHMQSKLGPMPFYYVLAFPFYLIGELGYFSLVGLILFFLLFSKINTALSYKLALLVFLMTSPFYLWEVVVRSNIFTTSMLITFFLFYFLYQRKSTHISLYLYAIIAGLLLSTRAVFSIPYIIFFMYLLRKKEVAFIQLLKFLSVAFLAFSLTFLPLVLRYPQEFFEMNPFIVQSTFLVPFYVSVAFIILAFVFSFFSNSKKQLFFYTGLCLFLIITVFMSYNLSVVGIAEFYVGKKADISYFIFCIPFFLVYLLKTNPQLK